MALHQGQVTPQGGLSLLRSTPFQNTVMGTTTEQTSIERYVFKDMCFKDTFKDGFPSPGPLNFLRMCQVGPQR